MANYIVLTNKTGGTATGPTASVDGSSVISEVSLADGANSPSTVYYAKNGAEVDWGVSFTDSNGDTKSGSVKGKSPSKEGQTVAVTLTAGDFTVDAPGEGTYTGSYS